MAGTGALVLTGAELLDGIAELEPTSGATLTARQLRYLDQHLSAREVDGHPSNAARLYGPEDVALVRLYLRLTDRQALSAWQARAVLALRNRELRDALRSSASLVLVIEWPMVAIVTIDRALRYDVRVPLRPLLVGVDGLIAGVRANAPTVWTGSRALPAAAAVRELREVRPSLEALRLKR